MQPPAKPPKAFPTPRLRPLQRVSLIWLGAVCRCFHLAPPWCTHLKDCQESTWHLFRNFEYCDLLCVIFFLECNPQEVFFLPVPDEPGSNRRQNSQMLRHLLRVLVRVNPCERY